MIVTKPEELWALMEAGRIAAQALKVAKGMIRAGMTTLELDGIILKTIITYGALPAFRGVKGYPFASCISVNDEVVHGLPSNRVLKPGDLVSIDTGASYGGYVSDTAISVVIPPGSQEALSLLKATEDAIDHAIRNAKPGTVGDLSKAIQDGIPKHLGIIKGYCGHGLGKTLHEPPSIPNFVTDPQRPPYNAPLPAGSIIAIEPMVTTGTGDVMVKQDGWTVATIDGRLCAHFEHTLWITEQGVIVLTKPV
jgi:methionyl aminopeptidase